MHESAVCIMQRVMAPRVLESHKLQLQDTEAGDWEVAVRWLNLKAKWSLKTSP